METAPKKNSWIVSFIAAIAILWAVFFAFEQYGQRKFKEANPEKAKLLTAEMLGKNWPFDLVYAGTVKCIDGSYIVFETSNGVYAINGAAKTKARQTKEWMLPDDIQIKGKDISPILEAGNSLCNK